MCKNSYIDEEPPRKRGRPWKAESSPNQSLSNSDSCSMQLPVSSKNEVNKTSISEPVVSSDVDNSEHSSDKTHQDDSSLSADSKIGDLNCPFCSKVFKTADGLVNHVNFKCKMNIDDSSSNSNLTSTHRVCPPSILNVEKSGSWKDKMDSSIQPKPSGQHISADPMCSDEDNKDSDDPNLSTRKRSRPSNANSSSSNPSLTKETSSTSVPLIEG